MLLGRREDVEDATAHGELAALLDQFHPRVRGRRQPVHDLFEVGALPAAQTDGLQLPEPLDLRLEYGPYGRDHDAHRAGRWVVRPRVRQPAQHREAAADRVRARGEPLVRQGLPRRVLHHRVLPARRHQRAQGRGEVLGLSAGGGDRQHGAVRATRPAPAAGQRRDGEGARGGRTDQVEVGPVAVGCGLYRFGERRIFDDCVEQAVQAHGGFRPGEWARWGLERGEWREG